MSRLLKHVDELAVRIGPRGATTKKEKQAASYVAEKLKSFGLKVETDTFYTLSSFSYMQMFFLFGFALSWILSIKYPVVAAVSSIGLFILYALDVETRFTLGTYFGRRQSQNVGGFCPAKEQSQKDVVIIAHYDSSKAALNFHPKMVTGFRRSFFSLFASLTVLVFLLILRVFIPEPHRTLAFWLGSPFVAVLFFVFVTLIHRELFCHFTPGANDNASGVAVLLEVAREISKEPLSNVDITFLATGAEEAGTFGILRYIKQHEIDSKLFINLDNLGKGRVFATSCEGIIGKYPADPSLLELATNAGLPSHPYRLLTTDATPILARNGRALSIMACDDQGLLPNWHWITDTFENVDEGNLEKAKNAVLDILRQLDKRG